MFQSPLKTVTEKLKPTQSKSGISSLKFERASDFKKFIGFIKTETEELEKIKLPTTTEIKPKSKSGGLLGLLGLGLLGGLGAFGGDGSNERTGSEGGTAAQFNTGILLTKNVAISAPAAAPYLFALTIRPASSLPTPKPSTNADKKAPPRFT